MTKITIPAGVTVTDRMIARARVREYDRAGTHSVARAIESALYAEGGSPHSYTQAAQEVAGALILAVSAEPWNGSAIPPLTEHYVLIVEDMLNRDQWFAPLNG